MSHFTGYLGSPCSLESPFVRKLYMVDCERSFPDRNAIRIGCSCKHSSPFLKVTRVASQRVKFQDRGKMMFPHRDLLPFCRDCSLGIKTYLNPSMYSSLGRNFLQVSTHGTTLKLITLTAFCTVAIQVLY